MPALIPYSYDVVIRKDGNGIVGTTIMNVSTRADKIHKQ